MLPTRTVSRPTLYRVNPLSFRDGNGDGVGDYQGMMSALPYLQGLSIDGVLLPRSFPLPEQEQQQLRQQGIGLWSNDGQDAPVSTVSPAMTTAAWCPLTVRELSLQVMPFSVEKLVAILSAQRATLADCVWSTGNTTQPRVVSHWGQGNLHSAAAFLTLLALLPAPICLYQGEELGLPHAANLQDPQGAQTPMPWYESPEQARAGEVFWHQRVAIEHRALAISRQQYDSGSTLRYCQRLLALRRLCLLQQGHLTSISEHNGMVWLVVTYQEQQLEALINLQPYTQKVAVPQGAAPLALLWQAGVRQEGEQWVLTGFASAIYTPGRSSQLIQEIIDTIFAQQENHPWQA